MDCTCGSGLFNISSITNYFKPTETIFLRGRTYRIEREIGSGGFATVSLVVDEQGRQYALKRILCVDADSRKVRIPPLLHYLSEKKKTNNFFFWVEAPQIFRFP
jgi:serine/threonine protein kinase